MQVQLLYENATLPTQATLGSVGYDFYNLHDVVLPAFKGWPVKPLEIPINELPPGTKIQTGVAVSIPDGYVGLFRDRSSYGSREIIVGAGVIDPDYRGEVLVCLINLNTVRIKIPAGSKIVQMLVLPVYQQEVQQSDFLDTTDRGSKGFGSSGS